MNQGLLHFLVMMQGRFLLKGAANALLVETQQQNLTLLLITFS
jgi:hypothetical protein